MVDTIESPHLQTMIEKLGGRSSWKFLIMTMIELIRQDEILKLVFKGKEREDLVDMMTNLIKMTFSYHSKDNMPEDNVRSRIIMRNYSLFELGLNSFQLKKLQAHFESALHNTWVEGDLFDQCVERFAELRRVFEEEALDVPYGCTRAAYSLIARSA